MDTETLVQILDESVCISHRVNILGEVINPIILSPAMDE